MRITNRMNRMSQVGRKTKTVLKINAGLLVKTSKIFSLLGIKFLCLAKTSKTMCYDKGSVLQNVKRDIAVCQLQ